MNKIFTTLITLLLFTHAFGQNGWKQDEMEVKVYITSKEEAKILQNLHIETEISSQNGNTINAYVIPAELERLKATGLHYSVSISNLNEHYRNFWKNQVPPGYKTYDQIVELADSLATNYPSICKKVIYGTTLGGRELSALKISRNVDLDEPEPAILFDGGIHGDEVLGPEFVIRYARDLCTGYGSNTTFTNLINTREIWLYYMVNPDGRANMSRYNNSGVDINRDAGYMWNGEGSSTGAFSQEETRALRDCMIENQFVVYTNYHAGTEGIVYPWSYRADPTPDNAHINQLASVYSSTSGYTNLPYGEGYSVLGYYSNGSTKDFLYGSLGNVGWSIEVSNDKQPPSSQISYYYDLNAPAMTEMINRCGYGLEGLVTDSLTGKPLAAAIWVNSYYPVYTDPRAGDYHKYVMPGNYAITVTANGYKSKTISNIGVPMTGSTITNFQLVPELTWFVYNVSGCQIPVTTFTGFTNPAFTPAVVGAPDSITYSLWRNGWIVLDMGDTIFNGNGNDFRVVESGGTPEGFICYAGSGKDGPWRRIGSGTGTTAFNLSSAAGGSVSQARYLKIVDDGDGPSSGTDLGFDLDAVEMITPPLLVDFAATKTNTCVATAVDFTDQSLGNPVSWNWLFPGGTPASSMVQNPENIVYQTPGIYNVSLTISNGTSSGTKLKSGFIKINPAPVVDLGNDTTINASASILLNAGNPGSLFLWSTGDTTQTIVADSAGVGIGLESYSVLVNDSNDCSTSDTIRITFSETVNTREKERKDEMTIYPNPTDGILHLAMPGFKFDYIRLFTTLGRKVFEKSIGSEESRISIDLSELPEGIYFMEIAGKEKQYFEKVVIR